MKIVKILNKIALIISSLFIWLAGINMLPDVTAAIATMNEFVDMINNPFTDTSKIYNLTSAETSFINDFCSAYSVINVFIIGLFIFSIILLAVFITSLFFKDNKIFNAILQLCSTVGLVVVTIMFFSNAAIRGEFVERCELFAENSGRSEILSMLNDIFYANFDYIILLLIFVFVVLILNAFIFKESGEVVSKIENINDFNNDDKSNVDSIALTYHNAIKNKIAEADLKLKTLELEKDLEEKLKKIKSLEEK